MKVLVVEDEERMSEFIRKGLEEQGMAVDVCDNGSDGSKRACHEPYDAIVLDIMLPGQDGFAVLRNLRDTKSKTPVILLTARNGVEDRVNGLNLGADDYLTKPFYMEELIARLRAISRRAAGEGASNIRRIGKLTMNLITREVQYGDKTIDLSPREFNLLEFLTRTPDRVYSRTQILEHVWSYHFDPQSNIVEVHIQRLRSKLDTKDREAVIETVRGIGYRIRAESNSEDRS